VLDPQKTSMEVLGVHAFVEGASKKNYIFDI